MILAKRKNSIYFIQYFNEEENIVRRIQGNGFASNKVDKAISAF